MLHPAYIFLDLIKECTLAEQLWQNHATNHWSLTVQSDWTPDQLSVTYKWACQTETVKGLRKGRIQGEGTVSD
eukprot:m.372713 g.372713  ORF g.372713 m.372713 type:complete len:73 (-) comp28151_c0_seq1:1918-2136(-)